MRGVVVGLAGIVGLVAASSLAGQESGDPGRPPASFDSLVAVARASSAPYRDPEAAIAAGYRPLGPDFPGMGRHWINPRLLVEGRVDVSRPPILEYASVDGQLTLVGVAYAKLVSGDEVPDEFPVDDGAWHFHSGSVDEEGLLRGHEGLEGSHHTGPRIALLHAWVWLENPGGLFATDNWALPFARLGLVPEQGVLPAAAKALSLASGGARFFEAVIRAVGAPDSLDLATVRLALERYQALVDEIRPAAASPRRLTAEDLSCLADLWGQLWAEIAGSVSPQVSDRLRSLVARQ